jgi:hypothetical protein
MISGDDGSRAPTGVSMTASDGPLIIRSYLVVIDRPTRASVRLPGTVNVKRRSGGAA